MDPFVLGVDGGNTKTIALVARTDGTLLGAARTGPGDIYNAVGTERALEQVSEAVTTALCRAEIAGEQLSAATFSMAGADWPEDFEFLRSEMQRRGFGRQIEIVNDAIGALRAGSPDGTGVAVVCGTATATGARSSDGRTWHSSFWQQTHGAEELGRKMLRAVYLAELGIAPPTSLTPRVLEFFDTDQVEQVLHALTRRVDRQRANLGKLARVLIKEAEKGDPVARQIVSEHGAALGDHALAAARRVDLEGTAFNLVLAGSVLKSGPNLLTDAIIARVRTRAPAAPAIYAREEPALGAVLLALEAIGVRVDESIRARLTSTCPHFSFFET